MLRKLKPLQKKISTSFSVKSKGSQRSLKSNQSETSAPHESQQMIAEGEQSNENLALPPQSVDEEEISQFQEVQTGNIQLFNSEETVNDNQVHPLVARYERALLNESVRSKLNVPEQIEEEKLEATFANVSSSSTSDSEFDWNETDESELDESEKLERQQRKLRQINGHHDNERLMRQARRLRKVYLFLMKLSRPARITLVGFLGSGIAILLSEIFFENLKWHLSVITIIKKIPGTVSPAIIVFSKFSPLSSRNHVLVWSIWLSISFAAYCLTSIVVDNLPPAVIKLFNLFYGSTPEKLKTQVELWVNVRFWTKVALGLTWSWVVLSIMFSHIFIFHEDPKLNYFEWVLKVAAAAFAAGMVLLFEKILLQLIKINFHRTSLKDRIEENEKALWALDQLAAAKGISHSPKKRNSKFRSHLIPNPKSADPKNDPTTHVENQMPGAKESTTVDIPSTPKTANYDSSGGKNHSPEGLSSPNLNQTVEAKTEKKRRRSSNFLMVTDHLTSAIANAALKDGSRKTTDGLASTHSAKKLAKKLFEGLDEDRGGAITRNEFEPYFKTASDAALAFELFDKDGNGDIDRKEMRNAVARIYRERRALATGLKDMSSAVAKLDAVLMAVGCVLTIFIWFFIFNAKGTSAQLVPMATIILGFSFIFGNAAKNLFESMLFIFSIHPYDVGDMVMIDEHHMYVLEFGLFSTTFQRVDGQVVVAPNSILSNKKHIINIRRSGAMWETTEVMVGFETPLEVLHEFRTRLRQYVSDNPREWKGGLDVNIDFISNQNLIQLIIGMEHKTNWQDWGARLNRRTLLMREMKKIMDELCMVYTLPIQPVSFLPQRLKGAGRHPLRKYGGSTEAISQRNEGSTLDSGASFSSKAITSRSHGSGRSRNPNRLPSFKNQGDSFRLHHTGS